MQTDLVEMARQTPPGMASIIATGPQGKTCRECAYWGGNRVEMTAKQLEAARVGDDAPISPRGSRVGDDAQISPSGSMLLVDDHGRRRWVRGEPVAQACMRYRALRRAQRDPEAHSRRIDHATPACSQFAVYRDPQPVCKPTP
jgi:hypothetical protein